MIGFVSWFKCQHDNGNQHHKLPLNTKFQLHMFYITKIFAISRFQSKDCVITLKGVNDAFREIQRLKECFLFGQTDGLTQKEDK